MCRPGLFEGSHSSSSSSLQSQHRVSSTLAARSKRPAANAQKQTEKWAAAGKPVWPLTSAHKLPVLTEEEEQLGGGWQGQLICWGGSVGLKGLHRCVIYFSAFALKIEQNVYLSLFSTFYWWKKENFKINCTDFFKLLYQRSFITLCCNKNWIEM